MPVLRFAGCLAGFFVPVCVAGAALCLWVPVGVCVPVVRPGALSVCCVAGFALCVAVGVCAVVCAYVLRL